MTNPILMVTAGLQQGMHLEINAQGIRIGRDPNNELHLDDAEVSRHHARVILHNGAVWVQDAGSRNGIFVNGTRVSGHKQVAPGAQIQIGTHQFLVELPKDGMDSSVSIDLGSITPRTHTESNGSKTLPLIVGAVLCIVLIGGMILIKNKNSGSGTNLPTLVGKDAFIGSNIPGGELLENSNTGLSLNDLLGTTNGEETTTQPKEDENLTAAQRLARSIDGDTKEEEQIPAPAKGVSARELRDEAHELYQAEYFHDALIKYKQCTMLDAGMEVCRHRTEKLAFQITELKQQHHNSCLRYLEVQQYDQALASCEMVLQLETNPNADLHQSAQRGIAKARAALNIDY